MGFYFGDSSTPHTIRYLSCEQCYLLSTRDIFVCVCVVTTISLCRLCLNVMPRPKNQGFVDNVTKPQEPEMTRQHCPVCKRVAPHKNGVCVWH